MMRRNQKKMMRQNQKGMTQPVIPYCFANRPPIVEVKESVFELRRLIEAATNDSTKKRLGMLVELIKFGRGRVGVRRLGKLLEVDPGTVQIWRRNYMEGGIEALLQDGRKNKSGKI
jgi:hypothetical protein